MNWTSLVLILTASSLCACDSAGTETTSPIPGDETADDAGTGELDATLVDAPLLDGSDGALETSVPLVIPPSLVATLDVNPYVEDQCVPITYPGWPYDAKRCTYNNHLVVTVADPSADRVARWIVESSVLIEALDGLKARDDGHYEAGLIVIAKNVLGQSSRIFPLQGQIDEGTVYQFTKGVTASCTTGCYCRINSTDRPTWCDYAADVLAQDRATCESTFGTNHFTSAWATHCLENHVASWTSDRNEHFRARAYAANKAISSQFPDPKTADGAAVVDALKTIYPFP